MEIATLATIKKELKNRSGEELAALCLRLAKYKKENKELLNYLLFESFDEISFRETLKEEIKSEFSKMNTTSVYLTKKSTRRILRIISKHIKFSDAKETALELLICFCQELLRLNIPIRQSKVMVNIYNRQLLQIQKILGQMDNDMKLDYQAEIDEIGTPLKYLFD